MNEQLLRAVKEHPYALLFATVSGAHLYGFPSPDSDYDLRGVHILPAEEVMGLFPDRDTVEISKKEDIELDLVTHDVQKFFGLLLKANGYVLEQLYSPIVVHTTPEHEELKWIAKSCITRHHAHHYFGFAENQWRLFQKEDPPRVKPLLYVFRVLLTGIHLMRTGVVEANLNQLNEEYKLAYIRELIGRKMGGTERQTLERAEVSFYASEYDRLRKLLEDEASKTKLVVAHAGMKEEMQGRGSGKVRDFALYGETTGETDDYGLPVRYNWAAEYRGTAMVVYGHTPIAEPEWLNRTINIDSGCVFGGKLTALRYPERELVSVPALHTYYESVKPFLAEEASAPALTAQQQLDDLLDIEDVIGKRIINTRLNRTITIREENAITALEVMSRFASNPKWLIYLPPTMSPCETSRRDGLLEHPEEAFAYYLHEGVHKVVCEQKHMGSRAVVVTCRDVDSARKRFGIMEGESGACYTRTGRRFFNDTTLESQFLERVRHAVETAGIWESLKTDWVCLDCELMPWSAKAQELLRQQYAPTGAAARAALPAAIAALRAAAGNPEIAALAERFQQREEAAHLYVEAYRRYCWPVHSLADLKLAPFHVLASESGVHTANNHVWHMETLSRICDADPDLLLATPFRVVDLTDKADQERGIQWWEELTATGGEGMVVKPLEFVTKGRKGLAQPAVKVRGREYLRIIYGPEYTLPEHLERLKSRGLGTKRSLALREFALGLDALERFVHKEPLRRVHECVFGVLALESEPVDPRL